MMSLLSAVASMIPCSPILKMLSHSFRSVTFTDGGGCCEDKERVTEPLSPVSGAIHLEAS